MELLKKKLEDTFQVYLDGLIDYSKEQFEYNESEEIWSLAQMNEHVLSSGYTFFLANINRCLEKRKGQIGGDLTETGSYILFKDGFPPKTKYKHPEHQKNKGPGIIGQSLEFYIKGMPELLAALLETIPEIVKDKGEYKTQHFLFGWLNAKQWLQNAEYHIRHHINQKGGLVGFYEASLI
jgi:hypothetical protein